MRISCFYRLEDNDNDKKAGRLVGFGTESEKCSKGILHYNVAIIETILGELKTVPLNLVETQKAYRIHLKENTDYLLIYNKETKQYETVDRFSLNLSFAFGLEFEPEDATKRSVFNNEQLRILISDGTIDLEKYTLKELGV
ncbi:hypothetical protein [Peptoniphilus sp. HCN-40583]|uniref:hypothetical protein n=1 Tax=Peptoniphilus sp. HCN-40583 TaxID=3134662 RepID=UPI0030BF2DE0